MHEVGLMKETLTVAFDHARRAGANRVHRLVVRVGALSGVEPEAFAFAFAALTPGTIAEGATLDLEALPVVCMCAGCACEFGPTDWVYECPQCGRPSADVRQGRELELAAVEVS